MEDLIIVGAGGMGRVVLQIIKDINQSRARWNVLGFIDDNPHSLDGMGFAEQVMGTIEDWQVEDTQNFVIAVGNPNVRNVCIQKLLDKGANLLILFIRRLSYGITPKSAKDVSYFLLLGWNPMRL